MNGQKGYHGFVFFITLLFCGGCEEMILGPQPKFIDKEEYEAVMNIYGILRRDAADDSPGSFLYIERSLPATSSEEMEFSVDQAEAVLFRLQDNRVTDTISFNKEVDAGFGGNIRYTLPDFKPRAGEEYMIMCQHDELPLVTGRTIVPDIPVIIENSVSVKNTALTFNLQYDNSISLYDVFLIRGEEISEARTLPVSSENIKITIPFPESYTQNGKDSGQLIIIGYDRNFAEYASSPNVFIKPNTYRPPFTTVEGGYGCFGSMNVLRLYWHLENGRINFDK